MAVTNNRVQFAKGPKSIYFGGQNSSYNSSEFDGVVYFASDSNEIYVDGVAYGIGGTILETLKSNSYVSKVEILTDETTHNQKVYFKYFDASGQPVEDTIELFKIVGVDAVQVGHKKTVTKKQVEQDGVFVEVDDVTYSQDYEVSLKIDDNDQVLSQSESGLKTTLSLAYSDKKIILNGKNGSEISSIDVAELTKDSFLQSGEVVTIGEDDDTDLEAGTLALKLVLKTVDEEGADGTTVVYIDAKDFVDEYSAGLGIAFGEEPISGKGVQISIKVAENGYLSLGEDGLSLDLESVEDKIKEDVYVDDLKISEDDERTISEVLNTLDSSLGDSLSALDSSVSTALSALDSSVSSNLSSLHTDVSALQSLTGADIKVGGTENIFGSDITTTSSIQEALKNLNTRLEALTGTDSDGSVNYDNATISKYLDNVTKSSGLATTGEFLPSVYDGILANVSTATSIADVIKAEDKALKELVESTRVNDIESSYKTSGDETYLNIELLDSNIPVSSALQSAGGVLASSQNVSDALVSINESITWKIYGNTNVTEPEEESEEEIVEP